MQASRTEGYTLIEALIVISILAILLCTAPVFSTLLHSQRQQSEIFELQRLLQIARSNAVNSGLTTTLCGSADGSNCEPDWSAPTILIFIDHDGDHRFNNVDKIIQRVSLSTGRWHWRGSNRPYLRFKADGTPMEWGGFTRCPIAGEKTAPQIILNILGRTYTKESNLAQLIAAGLCT